MKKTVSLILAAIMLLSSLIFVSCESENNEETPDDNSFTLTEDYVIVIPQQAEDVEKNAANTLKASLNEFAGLNIAIIDDYFEDKADISELEIVIGASKRPALKTAKEKAGKIGYTVFASGKRVYIYGSDGDYLDLAISEFINTHISGKSSVELPDSLDITYNHTFKKTDLKINGVDISEFKIVYGTDDNGPVRHNGKWIESGRIKDAALALRTEIYLLTNVKLDVAYATASNKSDHEIIVGYTTKRAEDDGFYLSGSKYTIEDYAYGAVGNKLVLAGGSSNACYFSGLAFIKACEEMEGSDFTSPLTKGNADLIRVACIGDSITDGAGRLDDGNTNDNNVHSYPVYLQKLLGFKYYVGNYGHGGQRMMSFASESPNYVPSYEFKPDVVIMMFGTNDANKDKYTPDWGSDAAKTRYLNAANSMISKYKSVNSDVQIFVMTPPSILSNKTHKQNCTLSAQYNRELAEANKLPLVDIWNISDAEKWVFNDGIHPQGLVYKRFAEVIYENIKDTIVK